MTSKLLFNRRVLAGTRFAELASGNMTFTHIPTRNMLLLKTFFIHGDQCSMIIKILLVCSHLISWVTDLLYYIVRHFITL